MPHCPPPGYATVLHHYCDWNNLKSSKFFFAFFVVRHRKKIGFVINQKEFGSTLRIFEHFFKFTGMTNSIYEIWEKTVTSNKSTSHVKNGDYESFASKVF